MININALRRTPDERFASNYPGVYIATREQIRCGAPGSRAVIPPRICVKKASANANGQGQAGLIRLGGLAIIVGLAIHVILNSLLKEFPPEDPTATELQAYLSK